jgi:dienelactone hydrolase
MDVEAPDMRRLVVAVARPSGPGPFSAVVVLHGTGGFTQGYVELAERFAEAGFVAVAGCWFSGSHFPGPRQEGPAASRGGRGLPDAGAFIACPGGPEFQGANLGSVRYVKALVEATRRLPAVRPDRVGLFGHSRGAQAAVLAASSGVGMRGVVASAGGYVGATRGDTPAITLARGLEAPLLMLHSTADRTVNVQQAQEYERVLRGLGKPVTAHYYEDAPHLLPFARETRDDVLRRAIAFFREYLAP